MSVKRIFVEKKSGFDVEARGLFNDIKENLRIDSIERVRIIYRYDIEGISDFTLHKEAAVNVLNEINPSETVRHTTLDIFQDVFDYAPPEDIDGLVDNRPQKEVRPNNDNQTRRFTEEFDQIKSNKNDDFSLEWADGARLLRVSRPVSGKEGIHNMDTLDGNGTWDGTASNIALSTDKPFKGSGSIVADYNTGEYIENDDMDQVDLSDHESKSTLFMRLFLPDASLLTSAQLHWGNSTAVHFNRTVTSPQFGSFKTGWNLIPFAWNGATETGTVDTTAIDFVRVTLVLSSSDTDIKVDDIFSALPEVRDLIYYSKYLFRSTAAVWKETPTKDTDIINLDTSAHNLFVYECIRLAALGLQGQGGIEKDYTKRLYGNRESGGNEVGDYARYRKRNPEEPIQPQARRRTIRWNKK